MLDIHSRLKEINEEVQSTKSGIKFIEKKIQSLSAEDEQTQVRRTIEAQLQEGYFAGFENRSVADQLDQILPKLVWEKFSNLRELVDQLEIEPKAEPFLKGLKETLNKVCLDVKEIELHHPIDNADNAENKHTRIQEAFLPLESLVTALTKQYKISLKDSKDGEAVLNGIKVTSALAVLPVDEALNLAQKSGMSDDCIKTVKNLTNSKPAMAQFIANDAVQKDYFDSLEAQVNAKLAEKSKEQGISL